MGGERPKFRLQKQHLPHLRGASQKLRRGRFWGVSVQNRQKLRVSDVCWPLVTCQTFSPSAGVSPRLHEPLAHTIITLAAATSSCWDPVGFAAQSNRQRCHHPAHALLNLQTALVTPRGGATEMNRWGGRLVTENGLHTVWLLQKKQSGNWMKTPQK